MLIAHVIGDKGGEVFTIAETLTLEEAARELGRRRVGALVVTDEAGRVVGLLSERDIVREIGRHGAARLGAAVASAMTRVLETARLGWSVDDGLERMTDRRIRHLPVVEQGALVGIVSIGDLVKHRIASVEAEAAAMQAYIAAG